MAVYIATLTRQQGKTIIILPKKWTAKNVKPADRYLFVREDAPGQLTILTEEEWANETSKRNSANKNKAAGKNT